VLNAVGTCGGGAYGEGAYFNRPRHARARSSALEAGSVVAQCAVARREDGVKRRCFRASTNFYQLAWRVAGNAFMR
jgi:hypothetical protein